MPLIETSLNTYAENNTTDRAIQEAEQEYSADGTLLDAKEELEKLRRKYFD